MKDKISSIVMLVLIVIGIVLFVMSIMNNVDPILYGSYIYFALGVIITLIASVVGIIADPSTIKGMVIGVVGMALVFILGYILSTGMDYETFPIEISEGMSHFSGMLLYAIYILFGLSVLTLLWSKAYSLKR